MTTTAAYELIFAAGITTGIFSGAGASFTTRIITSPDGDIAEDRFVTAVGTYNAGATLSGSSAWLMQLATFEAAAQPKKARATSYQALGTVFSSVVASSSETASIVSPWSAAIRPEVAARARDRRL